MSSEQETWQAAAARKREDRANRLKPYDDWSLGDLTPPPSQKNVTSLVHARLTDRERSFLASDVTDLAHRIATQECTAVEVTTAFCKAACAAQELTNCLTEVMFTEALVRANELDEHLSKTGKVLGPLHGIPISVKDHIFVKDQASACGYVSWAGKDVAEEDAAIVNILRRLGAIIYVKTTNPQALYALETTSNIYGRTTNPHNRGLAAGGSSGGEGSLIGSRAGLLGVGTDIGGSISSFPEYQTFSTWMFSARIPAAWCGLYALKPSSYRLPLSSSDIRTPFRGKEDLVLVTGPLARSVRDLELFCRVVSEYKPWNFDPNTLSIPWNRSLAQGSESKNLVIGLWIDDGVVAPHPPIVQCLHRAREALLAAGHEVVDWVPIAQMEVFELLVKLFVLDGGEDIRAPLADSGEPAVPLIEQLLSFGKPGGYSLAESWELNIQRDQLRTRVLKHWNETALQSKTNRPIDAILCPAAATLASPHDTTRWAGYSNYWNLMDLPAAVFPFGEPFDAAQWKSSPRPAPNNPRNPIEEFVAGQWDPHTYDGAPIGLQLVGRRWQEEKLLGDLRTVDAVINQAHRNN
ncbi:putative glutamyl-tRNA(Gln) amidotransferase subunit A, related protein [Rhizoctonia solani 123E]|uniref:Putative glutamyl-tRNA(Gln) amidotransferase subunit A, related protein n=1 Tax=Rhizoctonia solani 123E TaxID=1423351 RepID=A0A074S3Q0_9AGAM|nr:putative glutamyl-tRNA(Gln) amidotransferase subunit A, related protein [Rhizoctonia solani 123E]